jgi:hypothetical protein
LAVDLVLDKRDFALNSFWEKNLPKMRNMVYAKQAKPGSRRFGQTF